MEINGMCELIDNDLASLIHTVIVLIKFGVPILLIIFGMLDLGKGVIASKEDEIKKGTGIFIKRLISAVLVFFVITIVQFAITLVDDKQDGESQIWNCADLILNGEINKKEVSPINKNIVIECEKNESILLRQELEQIKNNTECNADIVITGENSIRINQYTDDETCLKNSDFKEQMNEISKNYNCQIK